MAIMAKATSGKNYPPHPEGVWQGVCVDVVDLGVTKSNNPNWPDRHKIQIRWQTNQMFKDKDVDTGDVTERRFLVLNSYTLSLNEKANLRHHLESWRGKKFTSEELKGFDVELVIGANCQLGLVHSEPSSDGKVYANISAILPIGKTTPKLEPVDYIRVKDRTDAETEKTNTESSASNGETETDGDDPYNANGLPF